MEKDEVTTFEEVTFDEVTSLNNKISALESTIDYYRRITEKLEAELQLVDDVLSTLGCGEGTRQQKLLKIVHYGAI